MNDKFDIKGDEGQVCWSQHLTDGADGGEAAGLSEGLKQGS